MAGIKVVDFRTILYQLAKRDKDGKPSVSQYSVFVDIDSPKLKSIFATAAQSAGLRALVESGSFSLAEVCLPGRGYTVRLYGGQMHTYETKDGPKTTDGILKISDKGAYKTLQPLLSEYLESTRNAYGNNGRKL